MDDDEAVGLAIGPDAPVHVGERNAGAPKLKADDAWERRARRQKQQRAEPRGERGRAVGDGVDVAAAVDRSEDDRVRLVSAEVARARRVEHRRGVTAHQALEKPGELVEGPIGTIGEVRSSALARSWRLGDHDAVAVCIESRHEGDCYASWAGRRR